ncbi:MAG: hypothetical protein R3D44_01930 [Hyphomicrobiaceae bacterium]
MLELLGSGGLGALAQSLRDAVPALVALAALLSIVALVKRIFAGPSESREGPNVLVRMGAALATALTSNWQLTLLALTAFVLSLASGWTTWDGMRNFTGEPILSLMITFGIQGVMLIIAWLIGESFAAGTVRGSGRFQVEKYIAIPAGILCFLGIANALGLIDALYATRSMNAALSAFANWALLLGVGLLVFSAIFLNQQSTILEPYLQSVQVMARNAVLWMMFLACMATSVFFSFDSLFSAIFPKEERRRAADIRATRQIAGVVNDIGVLAARRQAEEAEQLFRAAGWLAYEKNLSALARASQGAEQAIERYFVERMEQRRTAVAAQQERMATAKSGQAALATRKGALADELSRLKGERPGLAADLAEKKTELETRNRNLDAKRVEAMAEERGAEGTLKVGKGPVYRQRMAELAQMQDAAKIQEQRVRDAAKRMADVDTRIAQIGRELAEVDAELGKLKGEAETAAQRIAVSEQAKAGDGRDAPKTDPARVRVAFERALTDFRQEPTVERLNVLSTQCTQLLDALVSTPATKDRVRSIDCDPKQANEASAHVFALNSGLVAFAQNCTGGDKLPESGGTDALLSFGRKCLQDSGLPSRDSAEMAAKISAIDLNRDDKAHRFVVTWNAFVDGNRLAYLALAIAIAIDSLVFMSGLFGANAVRSPLTDLHGRNDLTADQLEHAIDSTLHHAADPRRTLAALLRAMHPIHAMDGFTSEIVLDDHESHVDDMRAVLVAASTIGAVRPVGSDRRRYLVTTGLARYFAVAQRKTWKVKPAELDRKELVSVIGVALLPLPQRNAEQVLSEMHPVSDSEGFAAETYPFRIPDEEKRRLVLNTLGAGATVQGAVKRENDNGRYFVSTDFYKTLLLMRAGAIPAFRDDSARSRYGAALPLDGGSLTYADPRPLAQSSELPRIEGRPFHETAPQPPEPPAPSSPRRPKASASAREPAPISSVPIVPAAAVKAATPPPLHASPQPAADNVVEQFPPSPRKPPSSRLASDIRKKVIAGALSRWGTWGDDEIEAIWHTQSQPIAEALRALVDRRGPIGLGIQQLAYEIEQNIAEVYEELQHHFIGDVQVLESEVDKVKQHLPALIMTPDGPYQQMIDDMILDLRDRGATLEDQVGNARLSGRELARYRLLEDHRRKLVDLDGALDRDEQIVALLDELREHEASPRGLPPDDAPPMS